MVALRDRIRRVAGSTRPVLVLGPSGSGKELVARAIHLLGRGEDTPLVEVNCGAFPESLVEAQLFGSAKGAFTGAEHDREGLFESAGAGSLFLDEIGDLPFGLQVKLLRVLESGRFRLLGSLKELEFHGRVVAATHVSLADNVVRGTFREDLYHRLNVLTIAVPSLDERREDIPLIAAHFLRQQPRPIAFSRSAMGALTALSWPGNVRQLRTVIERAAVLLEDDLVEERDLLRIVDRQPPPPDRPTYERGVLEALAQRLLDLPIEDKLGAIEEILIKEALVRTGGNKSAAARLLGIHRKCIQRRCGRAA
jgi:DNA-binding NtrC family response regulator